MRTHGLCIIGRRAKPLAPSGNHADSPQTKTRCTGYNGTLGCIACRRTADVAVSVTLVALIPQPTYGCRDDDCQSGIQEHPAISKDEVENAIPYDPHRAVINLSITNHIACHRHDSPPGESGIPCRLTWARSIMDDVFSHDGPHMCAMFSRILPGCLLGCCCGRDFRGHRLTDSGENQRQAERRLGRWSMYKTQKYR